MALLLVDGFESYGTSNGSAPSPTGVLARHYTAYNESSIDIEAGRLGDGHCLEFYSGTSYIETLTLTTNDTLIVGFALKLNQLSDVDFLSLYDDSDEGVNIRYDGGLISVYTGITLLDTVNYTLYEGHWYWIEFKVKCNATTGTYELKIGEETIISDNSVDTKAGSHDYHNKIRIGRDYITIDDLYICDGSGSTNNDFLGNVKVSTIFPDSAGNSSDFTPLGGANYTNVDEQLVDDDTSYVESSTSSHKDTYGYEAVPAGITGVLGLQIDTFCRETDATSYSMYTPIRSGGSDYDDTAQAIGTTDYIVLSRISETDPNTSVAWIEAGINAAEFGIKVS